MNKQAEKPGRIKKIKPHTQYWERRADELARSFAPPIAPCRHCGYPVVEGYCCTYCKSGTP